MSSSGALRYKVIATGAGGQPISVQADNHTTWMDVIVELRDRLCPNLADEPVLSVRAHIGPADLVLPYDDKVAEYVRGDSRELRIRLVAP